MDWSKTDPDEAGFATPAATVVSLAIATVACALTTLSVGELRTARREQARTAAEYALAGAQEQAALKLLTTSQAPRLTWTQTSSFSTVSVLAEYEPAKLGLASADRLDPIILLRLGVSDGPQLIARLRLMATNHASEFVVGDADQAPLWQACGSSLITPYGEGKASPLAPAQAALDQGEVSWRVGETWRLRATSADGWVDDRIVRFTGAQGHPAAVLERRFTRSGAYATDCGAGGSSGPKV